MHSPLCDSKEVGIEIKQLECVFICVTGWDHNVVIGNKFFENITKSLGISDCQKEIKNTFMNMLRRGQI